MRHVIRTAVAAVAVSATLILPAAAFGSGGWIRVTPASDGITDEISSVRTPDGALHVVWAPSDQPGSLLAATVSPGGAAASPIPIASGWAGIGNPAIARQPAGALVVVAGAQHSTSTADPIGSQALWSSFSGGASWSLHPADIADGSGAADPLSLAFGPDGVTPVTAWATSAGVFVHRGTDPAVPSMNLQQAAGWNCCGYDPGIAFDSAGKRLAIAWYSNATGHNGVYGQTLDPVSGSPVGSPQLLPGSSQQDPGERTEVVSRPNGGLYLADAGGSAATEALVWRYGDARATAVGGDASGVADVGVAADPGGRLWVFWVTHPGSSPVLHARRSNRTVTRWGAEVVMRGPTGAGNAWKLDGNAQAGKLDLLGLFTVNGSVATWDRQVLPGLTLKAKGRSGGRLTLTVTDAGQPVAGAVVRIGAHTARTNHGGIAHLNLASDRGRRVGVAASKTGYTPVTAMVKVPR